MPLYEYQCDACGSRFEQIRKFSDPPVEVCPNCGEHRVQKLLSSPAIQFKGTGFYITDYARKGNPGAESKAAGSTESKDSKGSGETKSSPEGSTATPAPATSSSTPSKDS